MRALIIGFILSAAVFAQDPAQMAPYQLFTFDGGSGNVTACANCYIYTYTAGTNTLRATYTDSSLATPNTNPVRTNGQGYAITAGNAISGIWVGSSCYKFVAKNASMATIWTTDNLCDQPQVLKALLAGATGASLIGFRPTSGDNTITVATALNSFLIDSGYTTWSIACAAAQGANKTLIVTKLWTGVTSVPCDIWAVSGGLLRVSASTAASVTGSITAPPWQQIFDTTTNSAASVLLPTPKQDIWVNWFGPDTTGVADSQPAFAAAIAAVANGAAQPNGATLRATAGTYLLNSTVTFTSSYMLTFHGSGAATTFVWGGNTSTPALMVQDCLQCELGYFQITGSSTHQLLYGIQTQNSGSGTRWTATLDRFINITIEAVAQYITTGVYMGGGTDGNNDQQYFESVAVKNYLHSGYTINHSQIYDVTFMKCQFSGNGKGAIGVENLSGNFHWLGGTSGGNTTEDFLISSINSGSYTIENARFEDSPHFLVTGGPAGNPLQVTLRGVDYAGNKLGCTVMQITTNTCPTPAPGGAAITYSFRGVLVMDNCTFGNSQDVPLTISLQGFGDGNPNFASIRSTVFFDSLLTAAAIFPGGKPGSLTDSFSYNQMTGVATILTLGTTQPNITLTVNAATPSIQPGVTRYFTGNTVPTVITGFPGCTGGQTFNVLVQDSNTSFSTSTSALVWTGASPIVTNSGDSLQFTCTFDNSAAWLTVSKGL